MTTGNNKPKKITKKDLMMLQNIWIHGACVDELASITGEIKKSAISAEHTIQLLNRDNIQSHIESLKLEDRINLFARVSALHSVLLLSTDPKELKERVEVVSRLFEARDNLREAISKSLKLTDEQIDTIKTNVSVFHPMLLILIVIMEQIIWNTEEIKFPSDETIEKIKYLIHERIKELCAKLEWECIPVKEKTND